MAEVIENKFEEWIKTIMVIPITHIDTANKIGAAFDPDEGGNKAFSVCRLSASGSEPATHAASNGLVYYTYIPALNNGTMLFGGLTNLSALRGRVCPTLDECNLMASEVIVRTYEEPLNVFKSLNLKVIQTPV